MGQSRSMHQAGGDVARRPRTNSDLSNSAAVAGAVAARHHRHRSTNNNNRSRFQQQNSTSSSSSSPSSHLSTDEDNRSEEDAAGGMDLSSALMNLGLTIRGSSSNSAHRSSNRRSEGDNASNSGGLAFFQGRSARNQHRLGGSQRNGSSASASEVLASGRLEALLRSLESSISNSNSSSAAAVSAMGTEQQQAVLSRLRHSLPLLQLLGRDIKCPVCHKVVPSEDVDVHLVMCLTRPVLSYNDDILTANKGECSICLEDMDEGDQIARLPCLCIYHKNCIDEWFKRKNTCPEHPPVEDD